MLYSSALDALETASMCIISPPQQATVSEIAEALSLSVEEFAEAMKGFSVTKGFKPLASKEELGFFAGNAELVGMFFKWGLITDAEDGEGKNEKAAGNYEDGLNAQGEMEGSGDTEVFASSTGEEGGEEGEEIIMDVDAILNDLCDMFKETNGREPTEDEVKQWVEQMKGLTEGKDESGAGEGLEVVGFRA